MMGRLSRWVILVVPGVLVVPVMQGCGTPNSSATSDESSTTTASAIPRLGDFTARADVPVDADIEIGRSVEGRQISVIRRGDPMGARVIVVGCIHGDESAGMDIVAELKRTTATRGVDLWLVPTMNPDGTSARIRHNAHGVDLNRNFPPTWQPLAAAGNWEYGGPSAASEPETRAMLALGDLVAPDLVLWYHQDLNRISPASGRQGAIRARYAELAGLPLIGVSGGTYTGTANRWGKSVVSARGASFTVELGPTLDADQVRRHAAAVVRVAREFFP